MKLNHFFQSVKKVMAPWNKHIVENIGRRYWHVKNGGTVLLVAHIDTVMDPSMPRITKKRIKASGLDDRLGVYMAMSLMSDFPDIVDVLITDDEEIGMSTAEMVPEKDLAGYNVIIGLDRGGDDFVHYGLADEDLIDAYEEFADCNFGMMSDIAYLNNPPCGCINVGIGYYKPHKKDSYAKTDEVVKAYHDITDFINQYHNVRFNPCVPAPTYQYKYSESSLYGYSDTYVTDFDGMREESGLCAECGVGLLYRDEIIEGLCSLCQVKSYYLKEA